MCIISQFGNVDLINVANTSVMVYRKMECNKMVTIYAPVKATIGMPGNNGKTATKTVMLADGFKADADTIADAVKVTASIVDTFAKGYHIGTISEDADGNIHINAIKSE